MARRRQDGQARKIPTRCAAGWLPAQSGRAGRAGSAGRGHTVADRQSPWPTLTLIVSLEAIFLSTFVMIGQNRQAAFQQAKADHDYNEQELELKTNTELTREIDRLTIELHKRVVGNSPS
jgi:hypothetical protein